MIAVIADDFTGAAEIGGIGLRHRLNVIIETEAIRHKDVDLLIVATDTRSMSYDEAVKVISKITNELVALKPRFIFKKLDSVLRGNIYSELKTQMEVSGCKRALIVAGNPVFGRIIRDGIYYINNIPLHQTGFATDPDFPVTSSNVNTIIGKGTIELTTALTPQMTLPNSGVAVGDVTGFDDLRLWAQKIDNETIPAGASGFFNAMLLNETTLNKREPAETKAFGNKALYVLGSSYPKDDKFLKQLNNNGLYISNMPAEIYYDKDFDKQWLNVWADDIVKGIALNQRVVALVSHSANSKNGEANRVKQSLGDVTKLVLEKTVIDELLVEGGSTVSAILNCLNIKKLFPFQELDTGIIRMKVDNYPNLCLTTKPGSYSWPDEVWVRKDANVH